jgi:hypothetical protein
MTARVALVEAYQDGEGTGIAVNCREGQWESYIDAGVLPL